MQYSFQHSWVFNVTIPFYMGIPSSSIVKHAPAMQEPQEMQIGSLGGEDPLEKGSETHSSILAWEILWTKEPGRL